MNNKLFFILFFLIPFYTETSFSNDKNFQYNADRIKIENNQKIIIAEGKARIFDNNGRIIYSDKIIYNRSIGLIKSFSNTKFIDSDKNEILTNNLTFNIDKNEINTIGKTEIKDNKNNIFFLKDAFYNLATKKGFGKKFSGSFSDGSSVSSEDIVFDLKNKKTSFLKANYTTCKKIPDKLNEDCPWWSLSSSETTSDKNLNKVIHKNALLKIKKIPVLYLPYVEHPDPSVKRMSGFLPPIFKSVYNAGKGIQLPYFWALDESQDITFSPVLYLNENPLMQTEIRKRFKDSSLVIDTSYISGYADNTVGGSKGSRNHFYLDFHSNLNNNFFDKNTLIAQIQRVSQVNYLKAHKINSLLVKEDDKKLENKIQILSFNNNSSLDLSAKILEDLNKYSNNQYEYLFPQGSYSYNLIKSNQNINFNSSFLAKKLDIGEKSSEIINQIETNSIGLVSKNFGISHFFKTRLTNINQYYDNKNTNQNSINNYLTIGLDNAIPFYKKDGAKEQILSPKLFIKYTTGSMKNQRASEKTLVYADIFSLNRSPEIKNPETGFSIGTGIDYEMSKKDMSNNVYLKNSFGIGQVFRTSQLDQMPTTSSLNNKQSNFAGYYNLSFFGKNKKLNKEKNNYLDFYKQNRLNLTYNFNLNKSLTRFDQNAFKIESVLFNKINANITFDEKNKYAGNERKIDYGINFLLNNNFYLTSNIVQNLKDNVKETEKIGIAYENDCIKIALNLQKYFYNNDELYTNNKSIFLNIIFKPFGNDLKPDLSSFVE